MCLKPGCPALTKNEDGTIAIDAVSYTHLDVYKRQDGRFNVKNFWVTFKKNDLYRENVSDSLGK